MISQIGKEIFNIPQVIARVYEPKKEVLYNNSGIKIISPTKLFSEEFKKIISL